MQTIKTPPKGIAKDKAGTSAPRAKAKKGIAEKRAAETSGAQESGVKKKRMTAVSVK